MKAMATTKSVLPREKKGPFAATAGVAIETNKDVNTNPRI